MKFSQVLEGTSLKQTSPLLIPETRCSNRALSAFFDDVNKEQTALTQVKQSSLKRKSYPQQADIQVAQQEMFNDLYNKIQVRRHLQKQNKIGRIPSQSNFSVECNSNKQTKDSMLSLCQSLIDADSTLSSAKKGQNCNQSSLKIHSPPSKENNLQQRNKSKRGHLWSTLKVLQTQISTQRERTLTEYNDNQNTSIDQFVYSQKVRKPKLKLQIKSVNFQKRNDSNRQQSESSSQRQSIFFYNKSLEQNQNSHDFQSSKQKNELIEEKKSFNVFYDNEDFMSSKYQSFKNRLESLKQQSQKKQMEMINNSSSKQTLVSNILSTPLKRSRATTQDSTQITSITANNISQKSEILPLPQISVFQTSPEIISISPIKKVQNKNDIGASLSEEEIQNSSNCILGESISINSLNQQPEQKPKKKIILKINSDNNKNSPILQVQNKPAQKVTEDYLSFSSSPIKNKSIQIHKLPSTRKVILYSQKNSTLNLKNLTEPAAPSAEEQKSEQQFENEPFYINEIFSSTTKYLESRKKFIFSKALLSRDPQKFEKDSYFSQSFYQTSM